MFLRTPHLCRYNGIGRVGETETGVVVVAVVDDDEKLDMPWSSSTCRPVRLAHIILLFNGPSMCLLPFPDTSLHYCNELLLSTVFVVQTCR